MENLLVALIIQMCAGDNAEYYVQDYAQDCHHYMINCAIQGNGEFSHETVRECHEAKKHKTVTNYKRTK